jgi:hypothetical protein
MPGPDHSIVRALARLVCLLVVGAHPLAAQQGGEPELPRRSLQAGVGLRDGGDFGGALWLVTTGARFRTARNVAAGASIAHTLPSNDSCPVDPSSRCASASITALEVELEFQYSAGAIQPYGLATLGVAYLSADGGSNRVGGAYSTGLGVSARAARAAWLYAEARWRQETFGSRNARGPMGLAGVRVAF